MRMTEQEVLEASMNAERLLASRCEESEVVKSLCEMYSIKEKKARSIIRLVYERWNKELEESSQFKRENQLKVLSNLYYQAFQKEEYNVCLKIEQFRSKIEGTLCGNIQVDKDNHGIEESNLDQDFHHRSVEELEYFARNGRWPEDDSSNTTH